MADQIKCYFEQYGKVNSVDINQVENATDAHSGFVEFKLAETAAAVLSSNGMHRIGGCDVQVKAAEPWLQPDHILNALDDYCLHTILSKLGQLDLANAANVCIRFNNQAESVFSTSSKKLDLTRFSHEDAKNLVKTFGSLAQSIHFVCPYNRLFSKPYECDMLSLIARYCTPALKELTFDGFSFEFDVPDDIKLDTALSKLDKLSFLRCYVHNKLDPLLSKCVELKELCIEHVAYNRDSFVWPKFDKLEKLKLHRDPGRSMYDAHLYDDITSVNRTMTKLSLLGVRGIRDIVQNFPNLVKLEFNAVWAFVEVASAFNDYNFIRMIHHLGDLTQLKVLKLNLDGKSAASLCAALIAKAIPIEHLQFYNGICDDSTIANISQMKQLKVLELCDMDCLTDQHMIRLAKDLGSHLEKLQLKGSTAESLTTIGLKKMLPFATKLSLLTLKSETITIDADDYDAILNTLRKRPEKTALLFTFISGGRKVNVMGTIQMENRHIFNIDEKRYEDFGFN